ncbi:hypothetical protein SDC9_58957 [bioreactor metagenome]|uniref:SLH domain-containing protein n=1 Tax=bioreactor metagenome TaxID=1076179 RepID=A0A644XEJ7_9ZZZZ
MKKRILAMLLAAAVCFGAFGYTLPAAEAFSDVTDADTATAVAVLAGMGIVSGYSDGLYHPGDTLTRAQFSKLAVLAENHGDQLTQSAYRSLFSDVGSSHWAHSYVNLAYTEGLVNGYGNGTFGPDDPVTVAQAVTIVLRILGYTTSDVGPFWPEDYMAKASKLGLLDGITKSSGEYLNRGETARLICSMLNSETNSGKDYLDSYASSVVTDAVVVDNDAEADDGTLGTALVYTGNDLTYYEQTLAVANDLVGTARGTLLLDKSNKVIGFVPNDDKTVTITISEAKADSLTSSAGKTYDIPGTAAAILEDNDTTYSTAWYDLVAGDQVTLFYASAGDVELVVRASTEKYEGIMLTGLYESASPSSSNPSTISILGISLDVTTSAAKTLKAFSVGDRITVVLNASGDIASVYSATSKSTVNIGVLGSGKVALACGLVATGDIDTDADTGTLVSVSASALGELDASSVSATTTSKLSVASASLGSYSLAEGVTIYEHVGDAPVSKIDLSDILTATVSADKIDYYHTNSSGKVDILLLDDVTGNQYTYGILKVGSVSGGSAKEETDYTLTTVAVENSDGTSSKCTTVKNLTGNVPGGIAVTSDGELAGVITLSRALGISHSDFDGSDSVTVSGHTVPIAADVQVYNDVTDSWVTLSEAMAFSDSFIVYYDHTLTTGAQVRVIVAQ